MDCLIKVDNGWAGYLNASRENLGAARKEYSGNICIRLMNEFDRVYEAIDKRNYYEIFSEAVEGIDYELKDIADFCTYLYKGKHDKCATGVFISAAINKIIEENGSVMLNLDRDWERWDYIGMRLSKGSVIVDGNANFCLGYKMQGGRIVVRGDAWRKVGHMMRSGVIIIEGSGGPMTGESMYGGKIIVRGNVRPYVGSDMYGGEIHIWGDEFDAGKLIAKDAKHGKIYHKDALIWKNGSFVV